MVPQDSADAELAALRQLARRFALAPATGLIAEADAVAALNAGLAEKRPEGTATAASSPSPATPVAG